MYAQDCWGPKKVQHKHEIITSLMMSNLAGHSGQFPVQQKNVELNGRSLYIDGEICME